ncbi:GNAT family N-acetyltransferase [Rhizobium helianthi]|uniref:GNAT family N-acetyltransferase n=1 Tax=Rhizobium helianthi TaxID=1132695 RepID=A0ABW4M4L8_9HYPH
MTYRLRDAIVADLPAITAIYRESVLNGTASYELTPPDEAEMMGRFTALREKDYPYIVVEGDDGALLGYAYASAFRTRPAYRWLVEDSIYLAPESRGKGLGKALLQALIDRCTALGFRQMTAVIGGASPASARLHQSLGFEHVGLMKGTGFKHDRWLDTIIMQRELGEGTSSKPDMASYPGNLFKG